jgi:hypothetical protein
MRTVYRGITAIAVVIAALFVLNGCATENNILRTITPGTTVYIAGWDDRADKGDQALIEQKPSGLWVVPLDAYYLMQPDAQHTVRVTLTPEGRFRVEAVGNILLGTDHDACLADGETYVEMAVPNLQTVGREMPAPDNSAKQDTDCLPTPSS